MYIGKPPVNGFHTKQQISGDGSETTFTLDFTVADETSIIVSDNAVVLEPKVGYSLAIGGTKIVFASAPANGQRTYVQFLGQAVVQNLRDLNGSALILDANGNRNESIFSPQMVLNYICLLTASTFSVVVLCHL